MIHIKNFDSFKESVLSDLKSKIGSSLSKIGRYSNEQTTSKLRKYKISYKKKSDFHYEFLHNKRIIAELYQKGEHLGSPLFKLDIYLYNSECPSENENIEKNFKGQNEQPYNKISKAYYNTENAIDDLVRFWSTKTNSGKELNNDLKIKL
jgi:hypothetical protein